MADKKSGTDRKPSGNKWVARYIKKALAPPAYLNPSYTSFDEEQGVRDYKIAVNLNEMNWRGMTVTAIMDNPLVSRNVQVKRDAYFRQLVMPWNNNFMVTPTDKDRLNNPAQNSFVSQRQMTVPNVYGQFYAFMKALSAAFGTLQQ
jgi:hypothetical protein